MINVRKSADRGYADHGWLKSFHSFSFAEYRDPAHMGFGNLRVINEDRINPGSGFGTHSHRDMEILSVVLDGALAHQDSMGNGEVIRPGEVQRMSAGHGVSHSEFNHDAAKTTHFLQIWILPSALGITPGYEQKAFAAADQDGKFALVAAPDGRDGAVTVHADARLYQGNFGVEQGASMPVGSLRRAYVHVVQGEVTVNGHRLGGGDALLLEQESQVTVSEGSGAKVLLFDLP